MSVRILLLMALIASGLSAVPALAAQPNEQVYGCESNPTGNPIGGGEGYSDIFETGDFICRTTDELLQALSQAEPGQVVFVPDGVEIDVTGQRLTIREGVTLAGTRGLKGSLGARVFTRVTGSFTMASAADGSRLTGLRFEGPHGGPERIALSAYFLAISSYDVRVDNCEIYNFNQTAIAVGRSAFRTRIHHNYIHHNQKGGMGYGVAVNGGGDVYIIANKFDYNRHHIASGGTPGCGYEAAWNWIGPGATSSHFDMHGGRDRGDSTDIAGDWMHIHHNTFVSPMTHVGIRGTPSHGADIHNNWFANAVAPEEGRRAVGSTGNTRVFNNAYGPNKTPQEHAICFADGSPQQCDVDRCRYCRQVHRAAAISDTKYPRRYEYVPGKTMCCSYAHRRVANVHHGAGTAGPGPVGRSPA